MLVSDIKGNNAKFYEFTADQGALEKFRENEMLKVPYAERIFSTVGTVRLFENRDEVYEDDLNFESYKKMHSLIAEKDKSMREVCELMANFYRGDYKFSRIIKILNKDGEVIKYFLLPFSQYQLFLAIPGINLYVLDNIISVPKSLYLLQMLEQGNFKALEGENVDNLLEMFTVSDAPVSEVNFDQGDNISYGRSEYDKATHHVLTRKLELQKKKK